MKIIFKLRQDTNVYILTWTYVVDAEDVSAVATPDQ